MSKKKTPPSYTEPGGPRIVLTHSYILSPFGPALKFVYILIIDNMLSYQYCNQTLIDYTN